jgi:adenylate cyclase
VTGCAGERPSDGVPVAVLSFDNRSTLRDDEGLAAGIAESMQHRFAGIAGFRLVAPAAQDHAQDGGGRPHPHFRIESSLQRAGSRLRITARLVDTTDGTVVWSQLFDRTTDGLFALGDKVARCVASAVRHSVTRTAHLAAGHPCAPT